MALEVYWASSSSNQLTSILKYWNDKIGSTDFSNKLYSQIKRRLTLVGVIPQMGRKTHKAGIYVTYVKDYSIYYKIAEAIIVVAIFDSRRDPGLIEEALSKL